LQATLQNQNWSFQIELTGAVQGHRLDGIFHPVLLNSEFRWTAALMIAEIAMKMRENVL
jgi:hypothetical protein